MEMKLEGSDWRKVDVKLDCGGRLCRRSCILNKLMKEYGNRMIEIVEAY